MAERLAFNLPGSGLDAPSPRQVEEAETPDLSSYTRIIVAFSGGKDSVACVLHLFDLGVRDKLELWHHDVDGREGGRLMDWPVTADYCRAFANEFDLPIYYSWRVGGFEREMCRDDAPTAPVRFEIPGGEVKEVGGSGPRNTRKMFPQVSASLKTRWCSAYLKVDPGAAAIRGQERFNQARTLVVTGERAEESSARAKYKSFEVHRSDARSGRLGRHVDHWRPVLAWREEEVWGIIERFRVNAHPCYHLGIGRASCAMCIFCSASQLATAKHVLPEQFQRVKGYEGRWGKTIHRTLSVSGRVDKGEVYQAAREPELVEIARSERFDQPIVLDEGSWRLPAGAFGESTGPT